MLTPEQRIEKRIAHEQKKLGLTDDQVAKLKAILEQNMDKLKADREAMRSAAAGTARQDARKTFMADMKSMREQMKPVLTPEQIKMWKQEKIDRIDRREERLEQRKQQLQK
jgi:Spy/CpxP family protein refolding chaperone